MLYTICIALILVEPCGYAGHGPRSGRRQQFGDFEGRQGASGAGHRIRGRRYDAAGRDSLCRTDRAAGRVASALRPERRRGGDLAVIEDRGFFPRSFFRPSGSGPAWDDSSGAGTVPQQRPRRAALQYPRLFASRNGTVNSRPCFAYGRNLSDSCIGKARGMLRGLFCAASNRSGRRPPPWAKTVRDAAD